MLRHIVLWKFKEHAETLSAYANHPERLKVVDYVKKVVEARVALDFEI